MSWCDLDLTFDLAAVTLTIKSYLGYVSETVRCMELIHDMDICLGVVGVQHLGVTFNFCSVKVCLPAIFETCFSYDKDMCIAATN